MHCLTMQHNWMCVTSCHRHCFMLPPIFWLKMRWKMLTLKAGIFHLLHDRRWCNLMLLWSMLTIICNLSLILDRVRPIARRATGKIEVLYRATPTTVVPPAHGNATKYKETDIFHNSVIDLLVSNDAYLAGSICRQRWKNLICLSLLNSHDAAIFVYTVNIR